MMSSIDPITSDEKEKKVEEVFKDLRCARTPEEVVSGLVELSEFIEKENLTPNQLEELKGIGCVTMTRHSYMEVLDRFGVLISIVTASLIAGTTITALYQLLHISDPFGLFGFMILAPFAAMPLLLLYYGKKQKWFT